MSPQIVRMCTGPSNLGTMTTVTSVDSHAPPAPLSNHRPFTHPPTVPPYTPLMTQCAARANRVCLPHHHHPTPLPTGCCPHPHDWAMEVNEAFGLSPIMYSTALSASSDPTHTGLPPDPTANTPSHVEMGPDDTTWATPTTSGTQALPTTLSLPTVPLSTPLLLARHHMQHQPATRCSAS